MDDEDNDGARDMFSQYVDDQNRDTVRHAMEEQGLEVPEMGPERDDHLESLANL